MKTLALAFVFSLAGLAFSPGLALADGCYICKSGSPCKQCRYSGKDNLAARKQCEQRGCKVGGTTGCSQASNVKTCAMPAADKPVETASLDAPQCEAN